MHLSACSLNTYCLHTFRVEAIIPNWLLSWRKYCWWSVLLIFWLLLRKCSSQPAFIEDLLCVRNEFRCSWQLSRSFMFPTSYSQSVLQGELVHMSQDVLSLLPENFYNLLEVSSNSSLFSGFHLDSGFPPIKFLNMCAQNYSSHLKAHFSESILCSAKENIIPTKLMLNSDPFRLP